MRVISGVHSLSSFRDRPFLRIALIGALAATLGLAACGRKGPLEAPPAAAVVTAPETYPSNTPPPADETTKKPHKAFFLDPLI